MGIAHFHPEGPDKVLSLYGDLGLLFHMRVGHDEGSDNVPLNIAVQRQVDRHRALHLSQPLTHAVYESGLPEPSDDEVEENLAEAIGPVPFSQWRLRTYTCDECNRLSFVPATDAWQTVIREHAFSKHAETLLPD